MKIYNILLFDKTNEQEYFWHSTFIIVHDHHYFLICQLFKNIYQKYTNSQFTDFKVVLWSVILINSHEKAPEYQFIPLS